VREPDPRLQKLWREIGEAIDAGEVQGLFVVWEQVSAPTHQSAIRAKDPIALLDEVKRQAIRVRARELH
jgi:hypothetical protein